MSNFLKLEQKLNELKSQFPHDEYIEKRERKNIKVKRNILNNLKAFGIIFFGGFICIKGKLIN